MLWQGAEIRIFSTFSVVVGSALHLKEVRPELVEQLLDQVRAHVCHPVQLQLAILVQGRVVLVQVVCQGLEELPRLVVEPAQESFVSLKLRCKRCDFKMTR